MQIHEVSFKSSNSDVGAALQTLFASIALQMDRRRRNPSLALMALMVGLLYWLPAASADGEYSLAQSLTYSLTYSLVQFHPPIHPLSLTFTYSLSLSLTRSLSHPFFPATPTKGVKLPSCLCFHCGGGLYILDL